MLNQTQPTVGEISTVSRKRREAALCFLS